MATPIESSPPPGWEREGIDGLLGLFPPGRLSEIVGPRSSGGSSLLLALIARITRGGQVAFVDGMDALDPASAAAAGADLSALLWVKCGGRLRVALSAADLLVRCPGFALVVVDLDERADRPARPRPHLRLQRAVEGGDAILIIRSARHREGSPASLVLATRRLAPRWMGLRPPHPPGRPPLRGLHFPRAPFPHPLPSGRGRVRKGAGRSTGRYDPHRLPARP